MSMPALPNQPRLTTSDTDVADEVSFRRFVAEHLAAQTLAAQRTEWYVRSTRSAVLILTALAIVGLIAGLIFGIVAATADEAASGFGY
ncbi:hypothetical protein [Blastococcus xanthinilyticus]|uniref:Uncharacterized protein n=1 Tax=Blastococcus xanthinilyticus TaxID=1564164 RepID=A0A5S5CPR6_9ACTN|nr:hypothetical protein [Blastococcus xanthinilyticus]TYP82023.1 hypothetical protein BD833_1207 [Blastococcus xanthinilyticus]